MERSHRKTKHQRSNASKHADQSGGNKDIASAAYDEYLWLLQKRNRLLKRLKTKDEQQVELEKKEQGFSLYINGANKEFSSQSTARQTKTADERSSSRKLLTNEFQAVADPKETNRAKTAPTKLTRKEWKPVGFRIKTEQGEKLNVNVPGKITGIYSEDFDEEESENDESETSDVTDEDSDGNHVEELSLSFNDVHKLRRSLERDSKIQESIQTVIECDSSGGSDEERIDGHKSLEQLGVTDIEDLKDNMELESEEEIEEDLELAETSIDLRDSNVLDVSPKLRGSYVIYEDTADEALRSARPVIESDKNEEDTVVLSFSKNKLTKRLLSATRKSSECLEDGTEHKDTTAYDEKTTKKRISSQTEVHGRACSMSSTKSHKKQESSFISNSQDVSDSIAVENNQLELSKKQAKKVSPLKNETDSSSPITDETVAMVTKKVRNMNASQQKQLLNLLAKLDPAVSRIVSVRSKAEPSIVFGSPESSPKQPLSPRDDVMVKEAKTSVNTSSCLEVKFVIQSNWGHPCEIGLTEVQFFDSDGLFIKIPHDHVSVLHKTSSDISLSNLVNGKTKTTNEKYMWKCRYTPGEIVTLCFVVPCQWKTDEHNVAKIKVWNYNKKMKDLNVGVKQVKIFTNDSLVWDGTIDKGCGNQIYDYAEVVYLKESKENKESVKDGEVSDRDQVVQTESPTLCYDQDEPRSPDIVIESSDIRSSNNQGPAPIFECEGEIFKTSLKDEHEVSRETNFSREENVKLPRKPPWLDEVKHKRSAPSLGQLTHLQTTVSWLDDCADKKTESDIVDDSGLFNELKPRSRPSSGRRSVKNESPDNSKSSKRTTPRPESGRRSGEQPHQDLDLHEQLTQLCVGEVSPEGNPVEEEKLLEESLNSLSQFKRCHQGRITPSNKIEIDRQGDALDDLLRRDEGENNIDNQSFVDDFVIPELPTGQRLVINILTTWGDHYYVGLNGVEVFNSAGKPVQIRKITADPSDINVLAEYKKDPRVVSNLIDGVYFTRDDMHLWLAPFTEGKSHFIYIDFKEVSTLAMIRIWNYNKSRIHSFRGAKDIEIFLDDDLIFRGEMARASGELGSSETFGDTILFTMNEEILEAMAANDQTYEPDVDEDEDFLQTSNNFKRPVTADTGVEAETVERPYTCPKERRKPTVEATYPNKVIEEDLSDGIDDCSKNLFGQVLELNLVETWGDIYYLGLTGLQIFGTQGDIINLTFDMLQACPKDLNELPEYEDDDRTLDKLIDGVNITMSDEHMWLIPFTPGENHILTITLEQPMEIAGLRLWNYNKSAESTHRGVKRMVAKLDRRIIGNKDGVLVRKGPGHCHFDFAQEISFLNPPRKPTAQQFNTTTQDQSPGDCELTVKPCGFIFRFQLFGSWGDPYYLGMNGLQFFDEEGKLIELSRKNITAYPESVNVLQGVKDDVRTPEKLIDGINDTDDGRHMWLAPVYLGLTNLLYVVFDEPTTISMIKLWNYRKTPIRGVRQFSILVDDLLVFNGILPQVPTGTRGILPNMNMPVPHASILFTDDETIRRKEKAYVINGGGFFENQEVCLVNEKTDFQQEKTTQKADQALRPKTSVTHQGHARR